MRAIRVKSLCLRGNRFTQGLEGNVIMRCLFAILLTMSWIVADAPAFAQFVPQVPTRTHPSPPPPPPPPQPPDINGPLSQGAPPTVVAQPRHLNTFSDRVTGC